MSNLSSCLISVVIPVYRSEAIVPRLCAELRYALKAFHYEVVMVNDCSPDNSWSAIMKECGQDNRFRAINLRVNVGQDRAIMAGLHFTAGAFVVIMDDDLQHNPADIIKLIEKIQAGGDIVYANFSQKKQTLLKNFMSWGAGKVAEYVMKKPAHIYLSPFKIMRREVVSQILQYRGPFPYIDGLVFQVTSQVGQIITEHHPRQEGRTTHTFLKQASLFLTLGTNFSILPLRIITTFGVVAAAISLLLGIYFFVIYFTKGVVVVGWTALVLINLFVGGMLMVSLGVIGEYIGRILMNVNQAPQFVIKETTNIPVSGEQE